MEISDRQRFHVPGRILDLITAYAPHNLRPLQERFQFHAALDDTYSKCTANVGKVIAEDLNARVGQRRTLEDEG